MDFIQLLIKSNTLNFLIVLFLIVFLLYKLNIKQKLQGLADDIKNYVDASENDKNQAQQSLDDIKAKISVLPQEIEEIKKSTDNSIKNYEEKIHSDIEEQKSDLEKNARRLFRLETKNFKERLTNLLSEKSIEIAKENAQMRLNENPQLHNVYIDKAIEELDGIRL